MQLKIKTRTLGALLVTLATSAVVLPAGTATADSGSWVRLEEKPADCPADNICLYRKRNYNEDGTGAFFYWSRRDGFKDLPGALVDKVGSFYADADGCFIDYVGDPVRFTTRTVQRTNYRRVYDGGEFGSRMNAIAPNC